MKALNIAVFIFILSLSISAVKEAYGLPYSQGPLWSVGEGDVESVGTVEYSGEFFGYNVFKAIRDGVALLGRIVGGALIIGSTLDTMIPFPLPTVLVAGLNILGATSAALAFVQFIRGVGFRGMD